jgi:FMN phosphatase YigB (HAD superfamily)
MGDASMNNFQAVVWDMGGVLIRTEDRHPRTALAAEFGLTYEMLESIVYGSRTAIEAGLGHIPAETHWKSVQAILKITDEALPRFKTEFWAGDVFDADLVMRIDHLRPGIKTGLLSNAWDDARNGIAAQYPLLCAFDVSIFSAEIKLAKPGQEIYQSMLGQLDVSAESCIFIDDLPENVQGARNVGMHGIRFINRSQIIEELQALLPF